MSGEKLIGDVNKAHMRDHEEATRGTTGSRNWPTITSLRLDIEAARNGRTWRLLPEGFRAQECGRTYPLPARRADLQVLAGIVVHHRGQDAGVIYLKRAFMKWRERKDRGAHNVMAAERMQDRIKQANHRFNKKLAEEQARAREAVDNVHQKVQEIAASLNDLFTLGKRGLDGQMRAHLDGKEWQGEKINSRAFRECFRMVTQAVKGLGLPSEERQAATETIMDEVAAAIEDTQSAVALAPGTDDENPQ